MSAYPKHLVASLTGTIYTASDVPTLKASHGSFMVVLCRDEESVTGIIAPVEVIALGVLGRCTRSVIAQELDDYLDEDEKRTFVGRVEILVCTSPFDGTKTMALIEVVTSEMGYFSSRLVTIDAIQESLAFRAPHAVQRMDAMLAEMTRYLGAEKARYDNLTREITFPTGEWDVYGDGSIPITQDRVAVVIKSFAARSLHVNHPLPTVDIAELKAALKMALCILREYSVVKQNDNDDGSQSGSEIDENTLKLSIDPAISAKAFAIEILKSPMLARALLHPDVLPGVIALEDIVNKNNVHDRRTRLLRPVLKYLLSEEYTHAALRKRTSKDGAATGAATSAPTSAATSAPTSASSSELLTAENLPPRETAEEILARLRPLAVHWEQNSGSKKTKTKTPSHPIITRFEEAESPEERAKLIAELEQYGIFRTHYANWTYNPEISSQYLSQKEREETWKYRVEEKTLRTEEMAAAEEPAGIHVPDVVTPGHDAPYIFTLDQILALQVPNAPWDAEDARRRLDIFVGGYLDELDLSRTLITGSAITASLICCMDRNPSRLISYNKTLIPRYLAEYGHDCDGDRQYIIRNRDGEVRIVPEAEATLEHYPSCQGYEKMEPGKVYGTNPCEGERPNFHDWAENVRGDYSAYRAYLATVYPPTKTIPQDLAAYRRYVRAATDFHLETKVDKGMATVVLSAKLKPTTKNVDTNITLRVESGADVDMAIDVATDEEFDRVAAAHYGIIRKHHPYAILTREERGPRNYVWTVTCAIKPENIDYIATFRPVEMYRANFNHIITHHVGMVSGAYTARFHNTPTFVVSARLVSSMVERETPNYYYFASRKYRPQDIILKYCVRGFGLGNFPEGIKYAIRSAAWDDPQWETSRDDRNWAPATHGICGFSVFSLPLEQHLVDLGY